MIDTNVKAAAIRLQYLVDTVPGKLAALHPDDISRQPSPGKWSKKQILGHLVDSAANNHQRFIRGQYDSTPAIFYDQNQWNDLNHYSDLSHIHIISFWAIYNTHIIQIISRITHDNLEKECIDGQGNKATLRWLIEDYVKHMEHHLKDIIDL